MYHTLIFLHSLAWFEFVLLSLIITSSWEPRVEDLMV